MNNDSISISFVDQIWSVCMNYHHNAPLMQTFREWNIHRGAFRVRMGQLNCITENKINMYTKILVANVESQFQY